MTIHLLQLNTYGVCDKLGILTVGAVVIAAVKYPDGVLVLLHHVAEELAEPRLVLLSHLRPGSHVELLCLYIVG